MTENLTSLKWIEGELQRKVEAVLLSLCVPLLNGGMFAGYTALEDLELAFTSVIFVFETFPVPMQLLALGGIVWAFVRGRFLATAGYLASAVGGVFVFYDPLPGGLLLVIGVTGVFAGLGRTAYASSGR